MEKPMGYHIRDGGNGISENVWKDPEQRKKIFEYCPELSLIMDMKLERERCAGDNKQGTIEPTPEEIAAAKAAEEKKKQEEEAKKKEEEEKQRQEEEAKKQEEEAEAKKIHEEEAHKAEVAESDQGTHGTQDDSPAPEGEEAPPSTDTQPAEVVPVTGQA